MSLNRIVVIGALAIAALLGRNLLPGTEADDELPPLPVMRAVDAEVVDIEWSPSPEVRDPFVPLVLPDPPAPSTVGEEGEFADGEAPDGG